MSLRALLILFFILGISSSVLPWVHYPKTNADFMGYMGDGIVTGILFFIALFFSLFSLKSSQSKIAIALYIFLGIAMIYLSYRNHIELNLVSTNFKTNNPNFALAAAGLSPGVGIYVLGLAGLGVLLTSIALFFTQITINNHQLNETKIEPNSNVKFIYTLLILGTIGICAFAVLKPSLFTGKESNPKAIELRPSLALGITKMGRALQENNYTTFIDYLHPFMIQSYGGKDNAIAAVQAATEKLKEKNTTIKDIQLSEVYDIKNENNSTQAIVTQQIVYNANGKEIKEIQKMIAISDDGGKSWKYININGKTKAEMIKFFPLLNHKLSF